MYLLETRLWSVLSSCYMTAVIETELLASLALAGVYFFPRKLCEGKQCCCAALV